MRIKKLSETATVPTRGSRCAAGYDLYADIPYAVTIFPGQVYKIPTNIAMEIPTGYFGGVYARSGLALKNGLRPAMCVGVIDSDYRDGIFVPLYNDSGVPQYVSPGDRVGQIIFQQFAVFEMTVSETLTETQRGTGGFGSTGT